MAAQHHGDRVRRRAYLNAAIPDRIAGYAHQFAYYLVRVDADTQRQGCETGEALKVGGVAAAGLTQRGEHFERMSILIEVYGHVHVAVARAYSVGDSSHGRWALAGRQQVLASGDSGPAFGAGPPVPASTWSRRGIP